jgi:hypothetical protein
MASSDEDSMSLVVSIINADFAVSCNVNFSPRTCRIKMAFANFNLKLTSHQSLEIQWYYHITLASVIPSTNGKFKYTSKKMFSIITKILFPGNLEFLNLVLIMRTIWPFI